MVYKLYWTREAVSNLDEILNYLFNNWSQKEVDKFKGKLKKQLELIANNPFMFPTSSYNSRLRKAVLSRQTSIFYEVKGDAVYLAYLFINRKDIGKIKK